MSSAGSGKSYVQSFISNLTNYAMNLRGAGSHLGYRCIFVFLLWIGFSAFGCLTPRTPLSPMNLTSLDLSDLINRSIDTHSANLIHLTAHHIIDSQKEESGAQLILKRLHKDVIASASHSLEIKAAIDMFKQLPRADKAKLFTEVASAKQNDIRKLGWALATELPSEPMAEAIKYFLTRNTTRSDIPLKITPEMALAIKTNQIIEAYPLLRASLMVGGHPQHVRAMFELNSENAPDDLLTYLAKLSNAEIVEAHLQRAGHYTILAILTGFKENFPSLHHPDFPILFAYALSKDPEVSESANEALTSILAAFPKEGALTILQLSAQAQNQYLQQLDQKNTPLANAIIEELRSQDPTFGH